MKRARRGWRQTLWKRVLAGTAIGVTASGVCCYSLYLLLGLSFEVSDAGGWVMLLAPLVTPALLAPASLIPVERSNLRATRLLAELAQAHGELKRTHHELAQEVAERAAIQARLEELVRRDPLTGLLNRRGFFEVFESLPHPELLVLTVDVDKLKAVNDAWGHSNGDRVLCAVAEALLDASGPGAHVARLGGDEFAVVVEAAPPAEDGPDPAQRVRDRLLDLRVTLSDGSTADVSSSVGMARFDRSVSMDTALVVADQQMYLAKRSRYFPAS